LVAVLLALAASASWGVSDFLGGLTSRRLTLATVKGLTTPIGLVVIGVLVTIRWQAPPSSRGCPHLGGLNRMFSTSPSSTTYSLPSSRCSPRFTTAARDPHSTKSLQRITSQRMKPPAMSE
jgi:hypothetical protein